TGDGIRWPQGDLALGLRQRGDAAPTGGDFSAQRLDLGVMAQVATRLPLGAALRKLLADVNPQGVISDIGAKWDGPLDSPAHYRVKGTISGLALAPRAAAEPHGVGRPGLRNASVQLDASEAGGDARIAIEAGAIELPGVFADPVVPLDSLSSQLSWKLDPAKTAGAEPALTVQLKDTTFANADARGDLAATWTRGDAADSAHGGLYPGRLELDARLASGAALRVARYLPLGIPEPVRHYVEGAVRGGSVKNVTFRVKGQLRDFPFYSARSAKDSEFRVTAQAEDATFAFIPDAPQWPALTKVAGELIIDRSSLEIRKAQARIGAVEWTGVQGTISNLADHPVLALDATAHGPLAEMLKVVNATPIGGWIGKSLATASATGPAELKLGLGVPLAAVGTTRVNGSVVLAGNDLRLSADTPLLGAAKGRVDFTQKGFTVVGATARVLGGDASFGGGTQGDDSIRFSAQGSASAEGLRRAVELGPVAHLAAALNGQAAYRLNLGFVHGRAQVLVASNLVGLGVDLPYPFAKAPATPLELRYQTAPLDDPALAPPASRESLRLELGNLLQAQFVREQSGASSRVLRGGIGVLAPAPTPAAGVAANLNLQRLDVDAWEAVYDKFTGAAQNSVASSAVASSGVAPSGVASSGVASSAVASIGVAPSETASSAAASRSAASSGIAMSASAPRAGAQTGDDYIPDAIALRAQELQFGTRRLTRVVVGASDAGGLWRTNVSADQLDGYVEYRPSRRRAGPGPGTGAGRVYARLSRLNLPKSDVDQVETLLDQQPANLPALDIVVDEFELRGKHLGHVEVEALNRIVREPGRDAVREWRLSKLNLAMPEARLTATGSWGGSGAGPAAQTERHATMDFKLALGDSGALLERLGVGKAIRGGKGVLSGRVSWVGSPFALDYPSLAGQVNVAIDSGQFLKAEPGAARLLSVLSLQSLPRRLSLDFRDLFQEGFAFDNVTGDVAIAEGVARTNTLRMRGPAAVVLMEGSADLARET
ncbi:MAG: YhdP family protein, partial [Caldimonas sp.]